MEIENMPRKRNQPLKPLRPGDPGFEDFDAPLAHQDQEYFFELEGGKVALSSPMRGPDPEHPNDYFIDIPIPGSWDKKIARMLKKNAPHVRRASGHVKIRAGVMNLEMHDLDAPASVDPPDDNIGQAPTQG
jgi:hypothetical protein